MCSIAVCHSILLFEVLGTKNLPEIHFVQYVSLLEHLDIISLNLVLLRKMSLRYGHDILMHSVIRLQIFIQNDSEFCD
jgi:hypothetical protein